MDFKTIDWNKVNRNADYRLNVEDEKDNDKFLEPLRNKILSYKLKNDKDFEDLTLIYVDGQGEVFFSNPNKLEQGDPIEMGDSKKVLKTLIMRNMTERYVKLECMGEYEHQ